MPAKSVAQRKFFGMLEHNPGMAKAKGVKMTHQQMHDFATTKDKGLPKRVKRKQPSVKLSSLLRKRYT